MAKKSRKYGHAAHIKRNTKGTSNEISFDVLDAARDQLEGDNKKAKGSGLLPGFHVPSLRFGINSRQSIDEGKDASRQSSTPEVIKPTAAASQSTPTLSKNSTKDQFNGTIKETGMGQPRPMARSLEESEREIARRKSRRRKHRRRIVLVVLVVVVAALVAGGYALYSYWQYEQDKTTGINNLAERMTSADEALAKIDSLIEDPLGAVTSGSWKAIESDIASYKEDLRACANDATALAQRLLEQDAKEVLSQINAGATARVTMLSTAENVFDEAERAQLALDSSNSAWLVLVDADNLARESSSILASAATDSSFDDTAQKSMDKSNEAIERYNEAIAEFQEVEYSYKNLDLSAYISYAQKRIESMEYAVASDQALIDRDAAEATSQNDAYTTADSEASALAAALPSSVSEPVKLAFDANKKSMVDSYEQTRAQIAASDVVIGDYLGKQAR